jgi:hypothetical protein
LEKVQLNQIRQILEKQKVLDYQQKLNGNGLQGEEKLLFKMEHLIKNMQAVIIQIK